VYKCEKCEQFSKPGEKQKRVVVETRKKIYSDPRNGTTGEGWEIVKEVAVCATCAGAAVV